MKRFKAAVIIGQLFLHSIYAAEYNIALNNVVTTSNNVPDHPATMVNDQDFNTYVQVNYDNDGKLPWILFDLKGFYNITKIIIWPTNDNDYSFARTSVYFPINNSAFENSDLFCTYDTPVKGVSFNCSSNYNFYAIQKRFVLLKKDSINATESLKIAEVAIITEDTDFLVLITGLAEEISISDNNTINEAKNAIDGNVATCAITNFSSSYDPQWWRVDLGELYQISGVNVNNQYYFSGSVNVDIYVDSSAFGKTQMCTDKCRGSMPPLGQFNCYPTLEGRFLTIERVNGVSGSLTLCEVQVVALHIDNSSSGQQRAKLLELGKQVGSLQKQVQHLEMEKIVIGVLVSIFAILVGAVCGFVYGKIYQKKRSIRPTESSVYEKPKNENEDQHVYSDVNSTPMKTIHTYDTVVI